MPAKNKVSADEQKLISNCIEKNDASNQEALYKHYYAYSMSISLRYAYSREEAEEIVNDSFIKMFRSLSEYRTSWSMKGWLRKIIVNTAIDWYRKEKKHLDAVGKHDLSIIPDHAEDIIEQLTVHDILGLLQELSEYQRLIFNLYEIEGYSHTEIADKLGIGESTSRSYLTRAKARLRILVTKKFNTSYERTF